MRDVLVFDWTFSFNIVIRVPLAGLLSFYSFRIYPFCWWFLFSHLLSLMAPQWNTYHHHHIHNRRGIHPPSQLVWVDRVWRSCKDFTNMVCWDLWLGFRSIPFLLPRLFSSNSSNSHLTSFQIIHWWYTLYLFLSSRTRKSILPPQHHHMWYILSTNSSISTSIWITFLCPLCSSIGWFLNHAIGNSCIMFLQTHLPLYS